MRIAYESNYCLAKLLTFESDVFANSREHLRGDAPSKVMSLRILESICGVMQRKEEIAFRGRCSTIPGQRCSNDS